MTVTLATNVGAMVKNLARGRFRAFCKAAMKHPQISQLIVKEVSRVVHTECLSLVGTKTPSMLRKKSKSELMNFEWDKLMAELQERSPTLITLLSAAADKTWNVKAADVSAKSALHVCVSCAILMKARNMHMSAVQTIVSLLLNAGHSSSLVSECYVCFNTYIPGLLPKEGLDLVLHLHFLLLFLLLDLHSFEQAWDLPIPFSDTSGG